ncbi:peptidylprolyl isomerase [Gemmobacter sp.]|uniref:peptidylprolyl isomerase n=1 Tax=Gemmobacter sp. TaxID=1898957 RepID=UPI002AFF526E|nr:peptidylprolyl isomerase [Gemmobacter sp.]
MRQTLVAATALLAAMLAVATPGPAVAQSSAFAPKVLVDGKVITFYEYEQRLRFMTLLNAPGDLPKEAEKSLIEDRLRMIAAERLKIRVTPDQITAGMTEFAGRFEMQPEEFVSILEQNGVAGATFRDFVHAGLAWREVVRAKFGPTAMASIYEPEIDRAMSALTQKGTTRVLLSEIIVPAAKRNLASELSQGLRGEGAFAAAARQHSLGPTAADGGRVGWRNVAVMPQAAIGALDGLEAGQVSPPVRLPDGRYAVYLLRQVELREALTPQTTAVDYARLVLAGAGTPATEATVASIRSRVTRCTDLETWGTVNRSTVAQPSVPRDVAARLAALDENEMQIYAEGGAQVVLMLCSRRVAGEGEPDRDAVRGRLVDQRVAGEADLYLQQLRSNAHIRRP